MANVSARVEFVRLLRAHQCTALSLDVSLSTHSSRSCALKLYDLSAWGTMKKKKLDDRIKY